MITVEEGRKMYNAIRGGGSLEVRMGKNHEAAVEAFFAQCQAERPVETAIAFAKYPVLSESQLEDRRAEELHAFGPEDDNEDGDSGGGAWMDGGITTAASLVAHRQRTEAAELARRRGEPV